MSQSLSLHYLTALMRGMDEIGEDRIMPLIAKHDVVGTVIQFLNAHWKALSQSDLQVRVFFVSCVCVCVRARPSFESDRRSFQQAACEFLALAFDSEEFGTHEDRYLTTDDVKSKLCAIGAAFVAPMSKDDREFRMKIRPLLDELVDCK